MEKPRQTTRIPASAMLMTVLLIFCPALAFLTLPFLYGPIALFTWRYDTQAICILMPSTDLAAPIPSSVIEPTMYAPVGSPLTNPLTNTVMANPAIGAPFYSSRGFAHARQADAKSAMLGTSTQVLESTRGSVTSAALPQLLATTKPQPIHVQPLNPAAPVIIPPAPHAAAAVLNPGGGAAHGSAPTVHPAVPGPHGWPFAPPHTHAPFHPFQHPLVYTKAPGGYPAVRARHIHGPHINNYANYLLTFLAVFGIFGSVFGAIVLFRLVLHTVREREEREMEKIGSDDAELYGTHESEVDPTTHPAEWEALSAVSENLNSFICAAVTMMLLQIYIVIATYWAFGSDGTACGVQGGYASLLIAHSRTYVASLWCGGGLVGGIVGAMMLMHKEQLAPYFLEINF